MPTAFERERKKKRDRRRDRHGNNRTGGLPPEPLFFAPLRTSLVPARNAGSGTPTSARASAAYVQDHEGVLRLCLANEARTWGARRVHNLVPLSQNFGTAAWIKADATIDSNVTTAPDGTLTASLLNEAATSASHIMRPEPQVTVVSGNRYLYSVWMKRKPGSRLYGAMAMANFFPTTYGATVNLDTGVVSSWTNGSAALAFGTTQGPDGWWRLWALGQASSSGVGGQFFLYTSTDGVFANRAHLGVVGEGVYIWGAQINDVTAQSVQTPSEYVSTGVLSSPFQGANVDGVQYFDTTLAGAPIPATTLLGYLSEVAGDQLVTPTAAIRLVSDASWVKVGAPTIVTTTGVDGVANACNRITSTAGNTTILQTLVAAASSRTFSVYIKRITGTGNIELTQDGATWTNINGSLVSGQWVRVQLNASILNASFGVRIVTVGDAIEMDFMQFEPGGVMSSPMSTSGVGVRVADGDSYVNTGNFNDAEGTLYMEVTMPFGADPAQDARAFGVTGINNNRLHVLAEAAATGTFAQFGTGAGVIQTVGVAGLGTATRRIGVTWKNGVANSGRVKVNSTAIQTAVGTPQVISSTITVGSIVGPSINLRGCIRNVRVYGRNFSDAELNALVP